MMQFFYHTNHDTQAHSMNDATVVSDGETRESRADRQTKVYDHVN